jgi:hypothetical protein
MPERQREPEVEDVTRPPAPPDRAPPPSAAARVLSLQRTHGNAAVTRMLARQPVDAGVPPAAGVERSPDDVTPPRAGDRDDMDRAIRDYMSGEHWPNVVQVLDGFSQAEIDARVKGYLPEWRDAIAAAAKDTERVRAPAQIENALRRSDHYALTQALNHYPDASRVGARIAELDANALAQVLRWAQAESLPLTRSLGPALAARASELNALAASALTRHQSWEATILLNALTDGDLEARLKPLTPPELFDLKIAADNQKLARIVAVLGVEPRAGAIKTEGLDRSFTGFASLEDWAGVAGTLLRYNDDAERTARLGRLNVAQLVNLALHMRSGTGLASRTPLGRLVESALRPRLDATYATAVAAANWSAIVWMLQGYPDADVLTKTRDIQAAHGAPGVSACAMWADMAFGSGHIISRAFAFLPLEAQTGATIRPASAQAMNLGAAAGAAVAVAGGTVTTYDQVSQPGRQSRWFGFSYQGADAAKTGWLQFLARECEMFDKNGKSAGFETSLETTAANQPEKRKWGTAARPYWTIDTAGNTAPFYEAANAAGTSFAHTTAPNRTEIYDRPDINRAVASAAFDEDLDDDDFADGKVAYVIMRMKFHDYLVRGMDVLYENTLTVEWKLTSKTAGATRKNTAGTGAAVSKLQPEHHEALVRRFPDWSFYAR